MSQIYGDYLTNTTLRFNLTLDDFDKSTILRTDLPGTPLVTLSDLSHNITLTDIQLMEVYKPDLKQLTTIPRLYYCWQYLGFKKGIFALPTLEGFEYILSNKLISDEDDLKRFYRILDKESRNLFVEAYDKKYKNTSLYVINYFSRKSTREKLINCILYTVYNIARSPFDIKEIQIGESLLSKISDELYRGYFLKEENQQMKKAFLDYFLFEYYFPTTDLYKIYQRFEDFHTKKYFKKILTDDIGYTELLLSVFSRALSDVSDYNGKYLEFILEDCSFEHNKELIFNICMIKYKDILSKLNVIIRRCDYLNSDIMCYYVHKIYEETPEYYITYLENEKSNSTLKLLTYFHKATPYLLDVNYIMSRINFDSNFDMNIFIYCVLNGANIEVLKDNPTKVLLSEVTLYELAQKIIKE
jgi:hypothetical protein